MSAIRNVMVPDIGDFKDIPVIEILVKPGDRVMKDTPLVVLESDKATLDVPSPESGTIKELKIAIGTRVSVGSVLLTLDEVSTESPATPPVGPSIAAPTGLKTPTPASLLAPTVPPAVSSDVATAAAQPSQITEAPTLTGRRAAHASPSIRRIAREFGIDLANVAGTGPRGRIVRGDLQHFVKAALHAPSASAGGDSGSGFKVAPWPQIDFAKFGKIERTLLSKIRKISGANLARNSIVIPHVTNFEDADITDLEEFRRTLAAETKPTDPKVTLLSFLIKAAAVTLAKYARFNASLDGDQLVLKHYFHIGFAADTPQGLVVPVIRDVNAKGILQIAAESATLAAQAREGAIKSTDMQGGCITVSSLGGIGGTGFTPIINAPEIAIIGVTRAQMRPVWNGKDFQPRLILPLMLSWDHRVVDGVAAARFLAHLSGLLKDYRRVLL
jgi:pyruvate dehydrogenase E2 component (dihydrolipoamide acetyltransferase)